MHKDAILPCRCVKSNEPADGRLKRKLAWHHPGIYLTILLHIFVYIVVALILQKKATIYIGFSDEWFRKRRRAIAVGWALVVVGVAIVVAAGFMVNHDAGVGLAGIWLGIVLAGGAIYGLVAARMVAAKRITDHYVWLKGVHPEFLATLPPWPYEP